MSSIKGMGSCVITQENGYPCGRQIGEGEAIGTVVINGAPYVGHKRCADAFDLRKQNGTQVVKRADQTSPGGAVGPMRDAVVDDGRPRQTSGIDQYKLPDGVASLADLPLDEPAAPQPSPQFQAQANTPVGLSPEEQQMLLEWRAKQKPEPHVIELDLSKLPANQDLHIRITR